LYQQIQSKILLCDRRTKELLTEFTPVVAEAMERATYDQVIRERYLMKMKNMMLSLNIINAELLNT